MSWRVGSALALVLMGGACGTSSSQTRDDGPALLLATDAYELQVRNGAVFVHEAGTMRAIDRYEELRELYQRDGQPMLPEAPAAGGTSVLGWRDLECVRRGETCGREPDRPARDMVRLKLRF
jgi:hypothetical protein